MVLPFPVPFLPEKSLFVRFVCLLLGERATEIYESVIFQLILL